MIVEGRAPAGTLPAGGALIDGGPASASSVQRALQLGAPFVELAQVTRGAAVVGAAAWYHGWKAESDRSRLAGALVGAIALRAATTSSEAWPQVDIDEGGAAVASPVERAGTVARLLLEPGVGPALPETTMNLGSVHLLDGSPTTVRITGTRSDGGAGSAVRLRIELRGQVHPVEPIPGAPGSHVPLHLSEPTMPVGGFHSQAPVTVAAEEVVRAWAADHGDHTVLVVATRHADDWTAVDDWASAERATTWFGTRAHVSRQAFANLSALRFVCSGKDRMGGQEVVARALADELSTWDDE